MPIIKNIIELNCKEFYLNINLAFVKKIIKTELYPGTTNQDEKRKFHLNSTILLYPYLNFGILQGLNFLAIKSWQVVMLNYIAR